MFHPNTQRLIDMWRAHRDGRRLPERASLSPIDLGSLLPQIFILGREDGREVFRLSGTLIADLHGRDLRGEALTALWTGVDQGVVLQTLARARGAAAPAVVIADAHAEDGVSIGVELCFAPLIGPSGVADRTIGLYQPISMLARLTGQPIRRLTVRDTVIAEDGAPRIQPKLRLVASDGRRVA